MRSCSRKWDRRSSRIPVWACGTDGDGGLGSNPGRRGYLGRNTGVLLAVYATTAVKGTILGLLGPLLITLGLLMKARLEEQGLREEPDPGAYDGYRKRVPMLVAFAPR